MENILDYINKSKEERQYHLRLEIPCIERGGYSVQYKALLAHILDTSIPSGRSIHLCHACFNAKCSNPFHLYWGTAKENSADTFSDKGKIPWDYMVDKYGLDVARKMNSRPLAAKLGGLANLNKPKSENHKQKISKSLFGKKRGPYKKSSSDDKSFRVSSAN